MDFGTIVEQKIREAQEEGMFENLPGKGKPLKLDEDAFEDPAWRMANTLLESNGFLPDWVQIDHDIRRAIEAARLSIRRTLMWADESRVRLGLRTDLKAQLERDFITAEVRWARDRFRQAIQRINREIAVYNLKVPSDHFQRIKLNVEAELAKVGLE